MGKTRLALRLQAELSDDYSDGVWLVDLSPVLDPSLVAQAVGGVLSVRQQPGQFWLADLIRVLRAPAIAAAG